MSLQDRYVCSCATGFSGVNCDQTLNPCTSTSCMNGGTCTKIPDRFAFTCTCAQGFTGRFCQQIVDLCAANPCKNGAVCINGLTTYTCNCLAGYTGPK